MSKEQFWRIFYFNFKLRQSAAETTRQINEVWGNYSVAESMVQKWFAKFRSRDFNLEDEPRSGRPTLIQDDFLRAIVDADPTTTTRQIAQEMDVSPKTIIEHISCIGKVTKPDKWVPHDLNDW